MPRLVPRRFTILDGMILTAASAVAFALVRWWRYEAYNVYEASDDLVLILEGVAWTLVPFTVAHAVLRLRKPRPSLRICRRQPGIQVSLALAAAWVYWFFDDMMQPYWFAPEEPWFGFRFDHFGVAGPGLPLRVGRAVALTWIVAAFVGGRRAEASWIDRLGRVVGWLWITVMVVRMANDYWWYFA